ncbi:hypothetical protein ABEX47_03250 [Paenibacillus ehimensis]|uniref:hypothetical protein n=1 Tax=Paenibacillus ehimensis TaxID=79264 RepID=UPI003D2E90BF
MITYRGYYKIKCNSCGDECLTFLSGEPACYECDSKDIKVFGFEELTAEEIVEILGSQLEDSNHHSIGDIPHNLLSSVNKCLKPQMVNVIFRQLYKDGVFNI